MIIAGPCLYTDKSEKERFLETAEALKETVDLFRCKIWGGGTTPEKYCYGMSSNGIGLLEHIEREIMPVSTEIHCLDHLFETLQLSSIWIGARNSQNYSLLSSLSIIKDKQLFIKRGTGMTIDELIGIADIMRLKHGVKVSMIERGVVGIDRQEFSRWSPDLKGILRLKIERPDIFKDLVVDCSHSVGKKEYIQGTYDAFKAIGVNSFMFECTIDGKSKTDQGHMLSVKELENIIKGV